ncbi:cupin domain-containing protein [Lentibacillus sp. Marseille-P4043]|uniref:cupin domain-containing protein n=1 Tax=Lentibacillus sp. Marseille-P4043 TaxID=2040293 RepID=UPI000D0B15A0|nr:cupin domain-containing protein [Lentibacillus sp. Marseille-P4043]
MELISVSHELTKPVEAKRVFRDEEREIMHIKLMEGEVVKEHDSPKHVFIFVKSGSVEFTVNNETHTINAETILHMDPKERHALKALSDVSILVMKC